MRINQIARRWFPHFRVYLPSSSFWLYLGSSLSVLLGFSWICLLFIVGWCSFARWGFILRLLSSNCHPSKTGFPLRLSRFIWLWGSPVRLRPLPAHRLVSRNRGTSIGDSETRTPGLESFLGRSIENGYRKNLLRAISIFMSRVCR